MHSAHTKTQMKIFVSHSSKDKWAARRIAKDIEELGHSVFLDEKDIVTGDSIDTSIQAHLKESDHLLLLLTPASLQSQWVLVELGGAIALGKRIVPILLYVGANEIPSVINLRLARDINDIAAYYEELGGFPELPKAAIEAKPKPKKTAAKKAEFKIGDGVIIKRNTPRQIFRKGTNIVWAPEMDRYLNQTAKVTGVDSDGDCTLDVDDESFSWAPEWLSLLA